MDYQFQKYVIDMCVLTFVLSISFDRKVKALSPLSDQSYSYPRSIGRVFVPNDVFINLTGELLFGPTVLFWPPLRNMSFGTHFVVLFLFSSSGMNKDM